MDLIARHRHLVNRLATIGAIVMPLILASPAAADDEERVMARVLLTTEPSVAQGCARVGAARDDSLKDLRRKIIRAGGNVAVLSFRPDELNMVYAEMFRCGGAARPGPSIPPPPPGAAPPPPAGAAPPPPAGTAPPPPPPPPPVR